METLPIELVWEVLLHLGRRRDVAILSLTNQRIYEATQDPYFIRRWAKRWGTVKDILYDMDNDTLNWDVFDGVFNRNPEGMIREYGIYQYPKYVEKVLDRIRNYVRSENGDEYICMAILKSIYLRGCIDKNSVLIELLLRDWDIDPEYQNSFAVRYSTMLFGKTVHEYNDDYKKSLEMVKVLHKYGADIHHDTDVALINACKNGYYLIVKFLLEQGATPRAQNGAPMYWARQNNHSRIFDLLTDYTNA